MGIVASFFILGADFVFPSILHDSRENKLAVANFAFSILIMIVFALYYNRITSSLSEKRLSSSRYSGCPLWMRWTSAILAGCGVALFFSTAILEWFGIGHVAAHGLPPTVSSGFGLIVNAALPAQLYSIRHSDLSSLKDS